ncbi:Alpha/beta hydrolase fold-3 domain protein [Stipitochalara longipes BDJ]|nr:Alpha/beta hydrolase fold-3 domain protein [Stipitochalara longipes BDJ]
MPFQVDPEVQTILTKLTGGKHGEKIPIGDIESRRVGTTKAGLALFSTLPTHPEVEIKDFYATAKDGNSILLRWYSKKDSPSAPGPAVLFIHGGGMIIGHVPMFDRGLGGYVSASGVPFLSVEYRLAPEAQYPVPVEDIYDGLTWLHEHAGELGVNPKRIAVMGESAGGGLAAAVTLLARERNGPAVAKQILVYPMLDDRTVEEDPKASPFLIWTAADNITGWSAMLGPLYGTEKIPETAAAARMSDAKGLPPTYIEVGELDLFRDEDVEFAGKLWNAGVSTELHVRRGCMHAFDMLAAESAVAKRAMVDRIASITSIEEI